MASHSHGKSTAAQPPTPRIHQEPPKTTEAAAPPVAIETKHEISAEEIENRQRDDVIREAYYTFTNNVREKISTAQNSYDQSLLTLSSALLGLSITFLAFLIHEKVQPAWLLCMLASWVLFAVCIIATLESFQLSRDAHTLQLELADDFFYKNKSDALDPVDKLDQKVNIANYIARFSFYFGVLAILCFIGTNIFFAQSLRNNDVADKITKIERGQTTTNVGTPIPTTTRIWTDGQVTTPPPQLPKTQSPPKSSPTRKEKTK